MLETCGLVYAIRTQELKNYLLDFSVPAEQILHQSVPLGRINQLFDKLRGHYILSMSEL